MTVDKIIAKVDALEPNQYTREQKINWISNLDQLIHDELYLTHDVPDEWKEDFTPYSTGNETVYVDGAYGDEIYMSYIQSKIAKENFEIDKYNVEATLFSNAYADYANYINRTYKPINYGPLKV